MTPEELKQRTKSFALQVFALVERLPRKWNIEIIAKQLLRSSTSVAANYRAVCKSRSQADFIAKICIVEEEIDETLFWLEFLEESGIVGHNVIKDVLDEARALTAIFTASRKTVKRQISKS